MFNKIDLKRNRSHTLTRTFESPDVNACVEHRERSNRTTLQLERILIYAQQLNYNVSSI